MTKDRLRADLKDGEYLRLSNLYSEALAHAPLSGAEFRVFHFVMRRTYGWAGLNREAGLSDVITAAEIRVGTGLPDGTCRYALAGLVKANVIFREPADKGNLMAYGINPQVDEWGLPTPDWKMFRTELNDAKDRGVYRHSSIPMLKSQYTSTEIPVGSGALSPAATGPNGTSKDSIKKEQRKNGTGDLSTAAVENSVESAEQNSASASALSEICLGITTRLGVPKEARQLGTWAQRQEIDETILQQALDLTAEAATTMDLAKPIAYFQVIAKRLSTAKQESVQLYQQDNKQVIRQAVGYAWATYQDPVIGGSWRQALRVISESFGPRFAKDALPHLPEEAREVWDVMK